MGRLFEGTCRICGDTYTGQGISSHIKRCVSDHAELGAVHHGLLIGARADGMAGRYWVYLMVRPEASLEMLDAALREVWFEEAAPSVFEIEETRYVSSIGKSDESDGSDESDESDGSEVAIKSMATDVGATIRPRMDFEYLYDPQDPTVVELTVYDPYPVPEELIDEESDDKVVVAAQNELEGVRCSSCEQAPEYVCSVCAEAEDPEVGPFVCEDCREKHEEHEGPLVRLVNTPGA